MDKDRPQRSTPLVERAFALAAHVTRRLPLKRRIGLITAAYWLRQHRFGFTFRCDELGITWSARGYPDKLTRHLLFEGSYQHDVLLALKHLLRPGDTMYDVGMHHGLMAVVAGLAVGPQGSVVGFEPNPELHELIHLHLSLNGLTNVVVNPLGLGARDAELDFYCQRGDRSWNSSFIREFAETRGTVQSVKVPITTLDNYVRKSGQIPRLIKIDCEGYDAFVLEGARETIAQHKPLLIVEFNGISAERAGTTVALVRFLRDQKYELCLLQRDWLGRYDFARQEMFDERKHCGTPEVANVLCLPSGGAP